MFSFYFKIISYFFLFFYSFNYSLTIQNEVKVLKSLYSSTQGNDWLWRNVLKTGPKWNFTASKIEDINPCCDNGRYWQGITCSDTSTKCCFLTCSITMINLRGYRLKGNINNIQWNQLNYLSELDLGINQITGQFPINLTTIKSLNYLRLTLTLLSGSIPPEIGNLTNLKMLDIASNQFTGSIPNEIKYLVTLTALEFPDNLITSFSSTIGELLNLKRLDGYSNLLSGPFPLSLTKLSNLEYLALYFNSFTGYIPSEISSMSNLDSLYIYTNHFKGPLTYFSNLHNLQELSIYRNRFTGKIPSEFSSLTKLTNLYTYQNILTGPIPSQMSSCTLLVNWFTWGNLHSGPYPSFFSNLKNIQSIDFASNYFTNTIPSSIKDMNNLKYFNFNSNSLSGSIPSEIGLLSYSLLDIQITQNYLSFSLPTTITLLTKLTKLNLRNNYLTGILPQNIGNLTKLDQLYLQRNHFHGKIHSLFEYYNKLQIIHLDLSDNTFTGDIPINLFYLSKLATLALTSNCFRGSLPHSICNATKIQVLSMDGLNSAKKCNYQVEFPFTHIPVGNTLDGTIPSCVWNFKNLTVLSLAANGLKGSIHDILPSSSLVNLSLSHNHLIGTIPKTIQQWPFLKLDLSYNKFNGEIHDLGTLLTTNNSQTVILEVNRLSGDISQLQSYSHQINLNVLNYNIFACDKLPNYDENIESYTCGSKELDDSFISFGIICFTIILLLTILYFFQLFFYQSFFNFDWNTLREYINFPFVKDNQNKYPAFYSFFKDFTFIGIVIIIISVLSIILCGLISILRINVSNSTHNHLYRWKWTISYFSGLTPSICILCLWCFLIFILVLSIYILLVHYNKNTHSCSNSYINRNNDNNKKKKKNINNKYKHHTLLSYRNTLLSIFTIFINIGIVGLVNGLYIYSTLQSLNKDYQYFIQIILAVFKWFWNLVFVPHLLLSPLKSSTYFSFMKIFLFLLNNVIIPSIATMLTSPSCYQGLLIEPDEIVSAYSYQVCDTTAILTVDTVEYTKCVVESSKYVQVVPLTPPFSYNYLCASTVLSAYIPVYVYIYCIEIIMPFCLSVILLYFFPKYSSLPEFLKTKVPIILWIDFIEINQILNSNPLQFTEGIQNQLKYNNNNNHNDNHNMNNGNENENNKNCSNEVIENNTLISLIKPEQLIVNLMQYLSVLMTFGICCPLLALEIIFATIIQILHFVIITCRFISQLTKNNSQPIIDSLIFHLEESFLDFKDIIFSMSWAIIGISSIFFSALCWDIAGDKLGWYKTLWIPFIAPSFCSLAFFIQMISKKQKKRVELEIFDEKTSEVSLQKQSLLKLSVENLS